MLCRVEGIHVIVATSSTVKVFWFSSMSSRKRKTNLIHLAAEMRRAKSQKRAESASSVEDVSVAESPTVLSNFTDSTAHCITSDSPPITNFTFTADSPVASASLDENTSLPLISYESSASSDDSNDDDDDGVECKQVLDDSEAAMIYKDWLCGVSRDDDGDDAF